MEWLKNLSKAIEYIESNLASDISYDEAANIACCSTYYFQRMFSYVAGIPLSEYIRRRRMTQAAFDLQTSRFKIMDIAIKYGYTSPTSFNRAFQSIHGISPSVARTKGHLLSSYPPIRFSISVTGAECMKYRIENKTPIRIVGIQTPLQEDMDYNMKLVPDFWDKTLRSSMFSKICNLANKNSNNVLGISTYKDSSYIYYSIGVETDKPVPDDMIEFYIPTATWVIFECSGNFPESVQNVFKKFITEWLPFSGYEYAELPDIEVYPISNDEKSESNHFEVWIAIKKERGIN